MQERLTELYSKDNAEARYEALRAVIPPSSTISEAYRRAATPQQKNDLLAALITRVTFDKTDTMRGKNDDPRKGIKLEIEQNLKCSECKV